MTPSTRPMRSRRWLLLMGSTLLVPFSACKERPRSVTLDVVLFSYLDRSIFDVFVDKTDIGVAGPWPYSGRGSMGGVRVALRPLTVSWRLGGPEGMARNGETVIARNAPEVKNVDPKVAFLGVHIYDDDTVELLASQHFPAMSERGARYDLKWRQADGK